MKQILDRNRTFNEKEQTLRNQFFGNALTGLLASGTYNSNTTSDLLIADAFEIAVKAVDYIDLQNPGENHKDSTIVEKASAVLSSTEKSKFDAGTINQS